MKSFESKFCEWDGWDEVGTGTLQFYVTKWTDYAKDAILTKGGNPDKFNVFTVDSENGIVEFYDSENKVSINYNAEIALIGLVPKTV